MIDFQEQPGGGQWQDPAPKPPVLDTGNLFMVGCQAETVIILNPPKRPITRLEALNLAAWLVALAGVVDPSSDQDFARMLGDVKKS